MIRLALLFMIPALALPLDHSQWDAVLKKYVREDGRVDYAGLKATGIADLESYLEQVAQALPKELPPPDRRAALVNAYNALTIHWILNNYPVESIWKTKKPFTEPRHRFEGANASLDRIENELRATGDARFHAVLVCAALSCPPLRREAYTGQRLDEQLNDNTRVWLARPDLNEFDGAKNRADVSSIFKWFREDFEKAGGLNEFLRKFAPAQAVLNIETKIKFRDYRWGLNDVSAIGEKYGGTKFMWDYVRNK